MVKFSVVVPIHNEGKFLPFSLPSIFRLQPDEVILIFDRCTDGSRDLSRRIAKHFKYEFKTKFINFNKSAPKWKFRVAFLRTRGYSLAKNDIILNTDADIILDEKIKEYLKLIGNHVGLISFGRKEHPFTLQGFIARLVSTFIPTIGFTGTYAFSKKAWQEIVKVESMKEIISAEDTYLYMQISSKYETRFCKTNSIHLRPREEPKRHFIKGITYWQIKRDPFWKMLFHSIIYLRPMVLAGYLYSRLRSK